MKKFYFVTIYGYEQDRMGNPIFDHIHRSLRNTTYFAMKIDLSIASEIKSQINKMRNKNLDTLLNDINNTSIMNYKLARPRLNGNIHSFNDKIVSVVEFILKSETIDSIEQFDITKCKIDKINNMGFCHCKIDKTYQQWESVVPGELITGTMTSAIASALHAKKN